MALPTPANLILPSAPREVPKAWLPALDAVRSVDGTLYRRCMLGLLILAMVTVAVNFENLEAALLGAVVWMGLAAAAMSVWFLAASTNPQPDESLLRDGLEIHAPFRIVESSRKYLGHSVFLEYTYGTEDDENYARIPLHEKHRYLIVMDEGEERIVLLVHPHHTWVHFVVPRTQP